MGSGLDFLSALDRELNLGGAVRSIKLEAHVQGLAVLTVEHLVDVDGVPRFISERFELVSLGPVVSEPNV